MKKLLSCFGVLLLSSACSRKAEVIQTPSGVNLTAVHHIGIAPTPEAQNICESELRAKGIAVLYSGASGLIFTEQKPAHLQNCSVTFEKNLDLTFGSPVATTARNQKADLPTLLRLIPAEEIGARSFVKSHPTFDGRKTLIAVLDTGVEVDHPMLRTTSTAEPKVIDFADMSGEGRVSLTPVSVQGESFSVEGVSYSFKGISGQDVKFGKFAGESLKYSEDIASKDKFYDLGVVTYLSHGLKARIDTNHNADFSDETELNDFAIAQQFVKLGEKKSLTASVKISEDGSKVDVCFDDGTHGTHVAGIAAGYDPKGLQGVAPGAQILAVKIGDSRLSGGSTTTASMLLAIDYAVSKKAHVINLSYGIRSGSNLGKSAVDQYVDKVAKDSGVLFSISAGNEGPGLLTTGTPAGANLAITNAAYVSKETAKDNYGYAAVEDDNTWYFSSVGPRNDGGLKPTLMAPGSALASVPPWAGGHANYRGTSMASPQVTGGLALLMSAALQSEMPSDRVSITQAVYRSAIAARNLLLIEQGHGLMSVPGAWQALQSSKDELPFEFQLKVNSPTAPSGSGAGIYVRSGQIPESGFTVQVTPQFLANTKAQDKMAVKTFQLKASAPWIQTPGTLWMTDTARTFQVLLPTASQLKPGLYSEKVVAIDEKTKKVAFVVPVTIVIPHRLSASATQGLSLSDNLRVGQTKRYFFEIPAGSTSVVADLSSDGPMIWGQLLDSEGRLVMEMRDTDGTSPMVALKKQAEIKRGGVYELDVVLPASAARHTKLQFQIRAYSFSVSEPIVKPGEGLEVEIQNNFAAVKVIPSAKIEFTRKSQNVSLTADSTSVPFLVSEDDKSRYESIHFTIVTSKAYYDLMTDYPYRVFNEQKELIASGGLELNSSVALSDLSSLNLGKYELEVTGAFTKEAPALWGFMLQEDRKLKEAISLYEGKRTLLETGQSLPVVAKLEPGDCAVIRLEAPQGGTLQTIPLCR